MDYLELQTVQCPYCWENIEIRIDRSLPDQQFTEDCQVCCQPIEFTVFIDPAGNIEVGARPENEG